MNASLGEFLNVINADDYFIVNIKKGTETIYFNYKHKVPDELKQLKIKEVYIDFASEAIGIYVTDK